MGWRLLIDVEGDEERAPKGWRLRVAGIIAVATLWIVAVVVLAVWLSRLVVR